jgi:hypothetical protein
MPRTASPGSPAASRWRRSSAAPPPTASASGKSPACRWRRACWRRCSKAWASAFRSSTWRSRGTMSAARARSTSSRGSAARIATAAFSAIAAWAATSPSSGARKRRSPRQRSGSSSPWAAATLPSGTTTSPPTRSTWGRGGRHSWDARRTQRSPAARSFSSSCTPTIAPSWCARSSPRSRPRRSPMSPIFECAPRPARGAGCTSRDE